MKTVVIDEIKLVHKLDESPDLSYLGKYVDRWEHGAIDREHRARNWTSRQYRYFVPAISYEEHWKSLHAMGYSKGDCEYLARKYNFEDFKRMEKYAEGDIFDMGISARARVSYPQKTIPPSKRLEWLESGGLWGISSDDAEGIKRTEQEQLEDLKDHLRYFGVKLQNFQKLACHAEAVSVD